MTAHELMIKTNHHLIKGNDLTAAQKTAIVNQLLAARSDEQTKQRFYQGVQSPGNYDKNGSRQMYPAFFIPPYNDGKKLKTIYNQTPKTHILSANMYELELIRLLQLLAPDHLIVQDMTASTLERLKTTCFGYEDDGVGECFDTSLVVLRFLAAVSNDIAWMQSRIDNYNYHASEKKRPWFSLWYFWLCLSELPFDLAEPELQKHQAQMLPWLTTKSAVMNSEHDKIVHPVLICSLRNCLCRLPEYAHIRDIQPYISKKDGRLHFDMNNEITASTHEPINFGF